MNLWKRYLAGMLSGAGSVMLKTALNIMVIPVLIGKLGLEAFGLYLLLIAILEMCLMLDMGAASALVTLLGGEKSGSEPHRAYLKVGHFLFIALASLFVVAGLLFRPFFLSQFHIGPTLLNTAQIGLLLIVLEAAIMIYSRYAYTILLAHCAHQWSNIADTLYFLVANLGALGLLFAGFDLTAVLAARLLGAALRLILMMMQACRMEPFTVRSRVNFQPAAFKKVLSLGSHALMLNFSILISHKIDDLVIAYFLPLSAVGIYEVVFRFLGITVQICLKLSEGAFPIFSRMATERQIPETRQFFLRMSSLLNLVAGLLILLILCHYTELFHIFSAGRIPIEKTWLLLFLVVPCLLSGVLQMPANAWLFTWGHQKYLTITSIMAALSNLILSVILVQWLGLIGVVLGTLIPQLIQHQAGLIRKTCRELNVSAGQYLRSVHGAVLLPLAVAFLWVQLFRPLVTMSLYPLLPITLISVSAAFIGAGLWFIRTASPLEKDIFQRHILTPLQARLSQKPSAG